MPVESSSPEGELKALLAERPVRPQSVADLLDGLGHEERVRAIRSLGRGPQRRLYEAVDGFRPLCLADLVPPGVDDFVPVRHFGRNTLPVFTHFEKRFCRPRGADRQQARRALRLQLPDARAADRARLLRRARGSGPARGVGRLQPGSARPHPEGWPEIASNDRGLPRLVFGFMVDTLRGVSEHVTIGSAARRGRDLGSWFVLCRED